MAGVARGIVVVGAAVVRHGRVLAARRVAPADVAGGWELPGGKVEPGESPEDAVAREVAEELGCAVEVTRWLAGESPVKPGYVLRIALASLVTGEPVPREHDAVRWLAADELDEVRWLASDVPFLAELRALLAEGERLDGGNVGGAMRVGRTVRRPTGPWTTSVHRLLEHLRTKRLPGVPHVVGADPDGREVLTFLPGDIVDVDTEMLTEGQLGSLVRWARALHAAVADFEDPGPWRFFGADHPELVAHNDLAPYNICFDGDDLVGVFDWDLAGPSTPLLELAFIAWNGVPLFRDIGPAAAARRLELIASTYGSYTATQILWAVPTRIQIMLDGIPAAARAGDDGMANLLEAGEPGRSRRALADLVRRIPDIEEELS